MDEYIATVIIEGNKKPSELKTFGNTPEEVIDNIVQLETVSYLFHIQHTETKEIWDFDADLEPLREIRELIMKTDGGIGLELRLNEIEDEDDQNLH